MYRQGDVLLIPVSILPVGTVQVEKGDVIILAFGEATGHRHVITDTTTMVFRGPTGDVFIDVTEHTEVSHQEHTAIALPPGKYRVIRQREYTPEAIRNVAD